MKTQKGIFSKEKKRETDTDTSAIHNNQGNKLFGEPKTRYQCPMKCEGKITYNEAGDCPVCNMHLVPVNEINASTHQHNCC